jgi:hypothetical protein
MRTPNIIVMALLLFLFAACSKNDNPTPDVASAGPTGTQTESTVEQEYALLKKALREGDGKTAAALVTASTIQKYETCRKLALDSTGTDFEGIDQMSVLLIFQLRYSAEKSRLQKMSERDVFEWGVAEGMVKKETLEPIEIHKVQYDGSSAFATVTQQGKVARGELLTFRQEDGRWKLDMMAIWNVVGKQLDDVRKQAGKSKVEMAVYLLERTHRTSIPPAILNGPLK